MTAARSPLAQAIRSLAPFVLVLLALFATRYYWVILPLSRELDCGACLLQPSVIAAWPLFGFMLVLFGVSTMVRQPVLWSLLRLSLLASVLIYLLDIYVYRNFHARLDLRDVVIYGDQARLVWSQFVASLSWQALAGMAFAAVVAVVASVRVRANPRPVGRWALLLPLAALATGLLVGALDRTVFPGAWVVRNVAAHNLRTGVSQPYQAEHVQRLADELAAGDAWCLAGRGARPNIVLLIAESWSPYHSALFSGINDWTPRLDGWAGQGRYFSNLHAGGSTTNTGLISILLGHDFFSPIRGPLALWPFHGLWGLESSLPHLMAAEGYRTVFMTNGNLDFSSKGRWLADIGFEEIHGHDSPEYEGLPRQSFDAPADGHLYRKALAFSSAPHDRPWLLVLENVSSHHPYTHPHSLERSERKVFEYMDRSMDGYLRRLAQQGFFDDNLLVVISDHRAMTMIDAAETAMFGLAAGARVPGFVLSGLVEAGEDARPLHQSDLLPSLAALVSGAACARRPVVDLLHGSGTSERCLYHAPNSDWHTVQAYCPQGQTQVLLAGSKSTTSPGLGEPDAEARVLDGVAMRRNLLDSYAIDIRARPETAASAPRPARPAIPAIDSSELWRTGARLPVAEVDPDELPEAYRCNVEFLNRARLEDGVVEVDSFASFAISGWVIDQSRGDNAPSAELVIKALDGSGTWLAPGLTRTDRPDVVAVHGGTSRYRRSGFWTLVPIDALAPGDYQTVLVYRSGSERLACGAVRRFRIAPSSAEGTTTTDPANR